MVRDRVLDNLAMARRSGWFVVAVLVASGMVALFFALQAIAAERSRDAVSTAMLRQYAVLAASEFARVARRDLDFALSRTLVNYVHPPRPADAEGCRCELVESIDAWFEVDRAGRLIERSGSLPAVVREQIETLARSDVASSTSNSVRLYTLDGGSRLLALRPEPHATSGGVRVGLVIRLEAIAPHLSASHGKAPLLPRSLLSRSSADDSIDIRVADRRGHTVFASANTEPGPQVASEELFPEDDVGLKVHASMTPAFVSALGPEHGAGPDLFVLVGLVTVNLLMVGVGVWQLRRERELTRLREDFVAGVSHELRTPLAQIRMFTETLLLDRVRSASERQRAMEIIGQETRRLSQLVENVLYFHRHRRSAVPPPSAIVDLRAFVLEVVEQFRPLAASKRIDVVARVPAHEVLVRANPDELKQVLLNLLDNAVKFGPPGQPVDVSVAPSDTAARIVVDDRGPGVPPADRRRIFRPYEQGRSRASSGGGIGLAIVEQIVTAHGGSVTLEDRAGGGARFVVHLPACAEDCSPIAEAGT